MSDTNRPILYLDSEELNSMVTSGDSADRTVKLLFKVLTPTQRKNFIFWLGEALKAAKREANDAEIAAFRAGVLAEAKKHEFIGGPPEPPKAPPKQKSPITLAEMFGLKKDSNNNGETTK
jgi:hypothetical protein